MHKSRQISESLHSRNDCTMLRSMDSSPEKYCSEQSSIRRQHALPSCTLRLSLQSHCITQKLKRERMRLTFAGDLTKKAYTLPCFKVTVAR